MVVASDSEGDKMENYITSCFFNATSNSWGCKMCKWTSIIAALIIATSAASVAQETQPYQSQAKDPYTNLFYGNMFFRNNIPFQGSPPESGGTGIQTQYLYGPDGALQGYSTQSGDTSHYYSGDGNYRGSSYKKSNNENFYSSDGWLKNGSNIFGR
jgi:hypothetical protein